MLYTICYTILCYATLCYAILYYTTLHYTILYYTILCCAVLYCTVLYYTIRGVARVRRGGVGPPARAFVRSRAGTSTPRAAGTPARNKFIDLAHAAPLLDAPRRRSGAHPPTLGASCLFWLRHYAGPERAPLPWGRATW